MTDNLRPQHIVELTVSNFKRVTAVDIQVPDSSTVILSGANSAGKSSVLDAIWVAVAGKRVAPDDPIRHGAGKAEIIVETQDLIITRRFNKNGSQLEVTRRGGGKVSSPQALLDELINAVGFDPLAFSAMAPKDQAEQLLSICPAEIDLDDNAAKITEAYEDRRVANRVLGTIQSQLDGMPKPEKIQDLINVDGLRASLGQLENTQQAQAVERERMGGLHTAQRAANDAHERTLEEIAALEERLVGLREGCELECAASQKASDEYEVADNRLRESCDPQPQIDNLKSQIGEACEINAVRYEATQDAAAYKSKADELKDAKADAEANGELLDTLRFARSDAIAAVEFPIDGLGIDADGQVTYNGVPLSQSSTSEQIRVGIAVAAAAAPGLRVCFVRNGSLLDADSMKEVASLADEKNMQVWIERVDDDSPAALHIVDGALVQ